MSAIYGVVQYGGAPVTRQTLAPMAAAISFWGPDGHGQWCGDCAGLGHLTLHVTPESLYERQPAGIRIAPHLIVTADARIDNRSELFDALSAPASGRDQTPDSSLILLAYERWGKDCVKRLLGDFAFAIWNTRDRTLFCARDPFGCQPFVYYHGDEAGGKRFVFASDVKGVLAALQAPRLNEPLLAAYLQMKTYHAEKRMTFFEEVLKLEPAHIGILTDGGFHTSRYWSPEDVPDFPPGSQVDYAEELRFLFRQAVECRLRSAFPIGSHLSGGLDSSSIAIQASRLLREEGKELATFSWSPPPEVSAGEVSAGIDPTDVFKDEYARIDAACRQEGFMCEYLPITAANLIATFQRDFTVEPTATTAREANVQVRAEARGIRVILSGWGGDDAITSRWVTSPVEFLRKHQWPGFRNAVRLRLELPGRNSSPLLRARRVGGILYELVSVSLPDSLYALTMGNAFQLHRAPCIQPAFARRYRSEVKALRGPLFRRHPTVRANICRSLDSGHLSMRMENWAGSGARHRMVYRYPMLDRRLVEFALGWAQPRLPATDQRRSLFQRALGDLLPRSVDWEPGKSETVTFAWLEAEHIRADTEWVRHLNSQTVISPAAKYVDLAKLTAAVQSGARSGRVRDLSGVREAFGFYAVNFRSL